MSIPAAAHGDVAAKVKLAAVMLLLLMIMTRRKKKDNVSYIVVSTFAATAKSTCLAFLYVPRYYEVAIRLA